jgi:hypothetical protein
VTPQNNQIVYCDGCNTPYHQFCHDPPIEKDVIQIAEKEWFCKPCVKTRELAQFGLSSLVPGPDLLVHERKQYFSSLPKETLVSLLTYASAVHPQLPLYDRDEVSRILDSEPPSPSEHRRTNGNVKLSLAVPSHDTHILSTNGVIAEEDIPDHPPDSYATASFPKPGQGIAARAMGPESEDMEWLVDDNLEVFSHIYHKNTPGEEGIHDRDAHTGAGAELLNGFTEAGDDVDGRMSHQIMN